MKLVIELRTDRNLTDHARLALEHLPGETVEDLVTRAVGTHYSSAASFIGGLQLDPRDFIEIRIIREDS